MANDKSAARPLSPHLQIYRPMLTMMMSIMHRITGIGLYFGIVLLVWWLMAAAISDSILISCRDFSATGLAGCLLFGFTWALIHHALGGLRHLLWDTGRGFDLTVVEWLARANLAGSIVLTLLLWVIGYGVMA